MSRSIIIALPSEKCPELAADLGEAEGVVSVAALHGASLKPPGDLLMVSATNGGMQRVLELLDRHEIGEEASIETTEPRSLVSPTDERQLEDEGNDGSWAEMSALLRRDTNVTPNYIITMFFAGLVAAIGLLTDMLHIVVGAMVLAPGFEPLVRVPFGLLGSSPRVWQQGLRSTLLGYAVLILGAAAAWPLFAAVQVQPADLTNHPWVRYWSTISPTAPLLALAGGAVGAAIISAQRSVLTVGVMITLALIPSMAIVGLAFAALEPALAGRALLRWFIDVIGVVSASALVFFVKRLLTRRREAFSLKRSPVS